VRGFAPGGLGPRDVTDPTNSVSNALGGTSYVGASGEVQFPFFGVPKEIGLRAAFFADAGTLWGYHGQTNFTNLGLTTTQNCAAPTTLTSQAQNLCVQDSRKIRASVGASILWDSPVGPIRLDFAYPLRKAAGDQTQVFNFSGGASF
jgi:outer membrane protein insertion porin family